MEVRILFLWAWDFSEHYHIAKAALHESGAPTRDLEKGVITKGVFSLEESLESLDSLKFSRISRKWTFLKRPLFQKTPFFRTRPTFRSC